MARKSEVPAGGLVKYREVQGKPPPKLGEFFKFQSIGDTIEGIFEGTRMLEREGRRAQRVYDVTSGGQLYTLSGNWDLNSKLKAARKGKSIRVTYIEDAPMEGRTRDGDDLNAMRVYKVEVEA